MQKRELSIFIDESGDFGEGKERPAYYLVSMIFHNQQGNIDKNVNILEKSVHSAGFNLEYIHTGPVIRREDVLRRYTIDDRRKLLFKMLVFFIYAPLSVKRLL